MRREGKASPVRLRHRMRGRKYPEAGAVQCTARSMAHWPSNHCTNQQKGVCGTDSTTMHLSDPNIDNLAFFYSLQTSIALVAKETRCKVLDAVQKCWVAFSEDQIQESWNYLFQIQIY